MKKNKNRIATNLLEALGELVLTVVFLGIGAVILSLFGVDFKSADTEYELIVLVGVVAFLALFIASYALTRWIKKLVSKRKKQEIQN